LTESFSEYLSKNNDLAKSVDETILLAILKTMREIRDAGSTLWIAGNGGSAATASHAVADFVKTSTAFGSKPLRSISLAEMTSLQTAIANDVSFGDGMSLSLRSFAKLGDGLLILSVSGTSPNLIGAFNAAKSLDLKTLAITGEKGKELCARVDVGLCLASSNYQLVENLHVLLLHWLTIQLGEN
jgi:D-sedoheptulose 7-phosphate isomerase